MSTRPHRRRFALQVERLEERQLFAGMNDAAVNVIDLHSQAAGETTSTHAWSTAQLDSAISDSVPMMGDVTGEGGDGFQGENLGCGAGAVNYEGSSRVLAMIPYQGGVLTAFANAGAPGQYRIHWSSNGQSLGEGPIRYQGSSPVTAMIPYQGGVLTAFANAGAGAAPHSLEFQWPKLGWRTHPVSGQLASNRDDPLPGRRTHRIR